MEILWQHSKNIYQWKKATKSNIFENVEYNLATEITQIMII